MITCDEIWKKNKSTPLIAREEAQVLFDIARKLPKGSLIVEIGSYEGRSSSILASVADARDLRLICIDSFDNNTRAEVYRAGHTGEKVFREEILAKFKNVTLLKMTSNRAAKKVNEKIDYIFIDGDHSYERVSDDLSNWLPKLRRGGYVSLHDYDCELFWGIKKAFKDYASGWEEVDNTYPLRTFRKPQ